MDSCDASVVGVQLLLSPNAAEAQSPNEPTVGYRYALLAEPVAFLTSDWKRLLKSQSKQRETSLHPSYSNPFP